MGIRVVRKNNQQAFAHKLHVVGAKKMHRITGVGIKILHHIAKLFTGHFFGKRGIVVDVHKQHRRIAQHFVLRCGNCCRPAFTEFLGQAAFVQIHQAVSLLGQSRLNSGIYCHTLECALHLTAIKLRGYRFQQFLRAKGLGNVIVCPGHHGHAHVRALVQEGQKYHGRCRNAGIAPQRCQDLQSVHARHLHITDDEVGPMQAHKGHAVDPVVSRQDLVALFFQY